ncbi:MAG: GNAT family N-acetyltransferase [Gammaproteobacteria bacterium]
MTELQNRAKIRPLIADDFDSVVSIDAVNGGRRRPAFFEKRLAAALAEPNYFIYIGYEDDDRLAGYLLARLHEGEYGESRPVAVLDAIGVTPECQGQGVGTALLQKLEAVLKHKNVTEIQTQADWHNLGFLRFISAAGFQLAPKQVLDRGVDYMDTLAVADPVQSFQVDTMEQDFSGPSADDAQALARDRVYCRTLAADDFPALVRIDRNITGRDNTAYYQRKMKEVLDETGIRVSLVAEIKGQVFGFIMARVDFGEFGRTEPTAVLDSIGVDPGFSHHLVGSALLSQLLGNLTALRLETIRTEVSADHFDVLNFLMQNGFHPSQELAFSYHLD